MIGSPPVRLEADEVGKWFGEVVAVGRCSLEVGRGVVGLLGQNGAGKTTLFKLLAGLITPSRGVVRLDGLPLRDHVGLYRRVGFCPESDALPGWLTGREFLTMLVRLAGVPSERVKPRVGELLERFALTGAANRRLGGYSKGMRQKLKLAQALAHDPDILFMDEPLNGMDPVSRRDAIGAIHALGDEGRTVLVSSHILPEVEEMTRRIVLIHRGKVLAEGDVTEIRDLIPEHPTVVSLRCERPRELASFLVRQDHVMGVECDGQDRVVVRTDHALAFYRALPGQLLASGLAVEEIHTLDDNLESVFSYLTDD
ncbi:MAG TPA: ABC transporter ATP-binding protein [Candidatus Krumholzibacteria bacterium]|nr:ABC transporter ATP-binding protein [Candidatus Krumholzibacteria bacterium]HPD72151.1 ABC transporter ATP-binding protein [Candidatus Krumholzibacteria bacterium]HRY40917.1 ABC transporter ATP-binding protein [Candidatus Krumholzibacteria bacterium]